MLFILDVIIAALASYVAYKTFQAWRGLSEARLSLYSIGNGPPGRLARAGGRGDIYLNWLTGTEPTKFIRRQEALFRLVIQLLATAALVPIAIAVTPSLFYAVVPPLFLLAPINALLALYIAAVTLVKSLERKTPPLISLAFVFLAASLVTPLHAPASVVFRLLTAVMLALGVIYAEKEKKQA
jgi:hypothetical protein